MAERIDHEATLIQREVEDLKNCYDGTPAAELRCRIATAVQRRKEQCFELSEEAVEEIVYAFSGWDVHIPDTLIVPAEKLEWLMQYSFDSVCDMHSPDQLRRRSVTRLRCLFFMIDEAAEKAQRALQSQN